MASYEAYLGVGIDASGAQAGAAQFGIATDKMSAASRKFQQQLDQAMFALKAFAVATAGLVVREISNFTQALSNARAMTNATASDMAKLEKVTRDLGASTAFSATQVADAAAMLGQAGFTVEQINKTLPATLDLAAAATIGMAQAADITAGAMAGFGIAAENSSQVADILAAVATGAKTDITGLGGAMKMVGPVAKSVGWTLGETTAILGVLANKNIEGSMAGTALKSVISSLVNPSNNAKNAIKALGISVDEIRPGVVDSVDIFKRLAAANLDTTSAFEIFGERGAVGVLAVIDALQDLDRMTGVVDNATGAARRMAEIKLDDIAGDFEQLTGALAELALKVGDTGLTGNLRKLTQELTTTITNFGNWWDVVMKTREQAQLLADVLNVVKNAVITLMALRLAEWLFVAGNAMRLLNVAMSANPYVLLAAGLGTLALHLKDVHDETTRLTQETDKQTESLKKMGDMGSQAGLKMQKSFLEARKLAVQGADTIEALNKQIEEREQQRAQRAEIASKVGIMTKDRTDPGTAALAGGFSDPILADLYARRLEIQNIEKELKSIEQKQRESASDAFKIGRKWGRSLVDGIQSIDKKDIANFLSSYVPGVKTMMGFQTSDVPVDYDAGGAKKEPMIYDAGGAKKEPMMEGELRNMQLAVELAKNLGMAESELYRIRLNAQALQDARENGQKSISATTQKQIEQAVALKAEEDKLTTVYEARKGLDDNLKARLKTAMEAVSVAQNMGASEADLLRMTLESQASEATRKMGLKGLTDEMQTMIDKIVALTGLAAEYKKAFEDDKIKRVSNWP